MDEKSTHLIKAVQPTQYSDKAVQPTQYSDKAVQPTQYSDKAVQPTQYSDEEMAELKKFIEVIKKDESRSALACWGNHGDYTHGY